MIPNITNPLVLLLRILIFFKDFRKTVKFDFGDKCQYRKFVNITFRIILNKGAIAPYLVNLTNGN